MEGGGEEMGGKRGRGSEGIRRGNGKERGERGKAEKGREKRMEGKGKRVKEKRRKIGWVEKTGGEEEGEEREK